MTLALGATTLLALGLGLGLGMAPEPACHFPDASRLVTVRDGRQLARALAGARAGDLILLAEGTYTGPKLVASASGTATAPIVVCGPRGAVLDGGDVARGYGLHVTGDRWIFTGFEITRFKKGVVLDGASHVQLVNLEIADIGNEGVRFRASSSDNVLARSFIHHTGRHGSPHHGEGVYVGSAASQWCLHSACLPDRSDRNRIEGNTIGPETTAEQVDVKEGTTGTVVRANVFSGEGMVAPEGADSWVDVKGNFAVVEGNRGTASPRDGFQVYAKAPGWGEGNVFRGNVADVRGAGVGFKITGGSGNVVACDNVVTGAKRGMANVACRAE